VSDGEDEKNDLGRSISWAISGGGGVRNCYLEREENCQESQIRMVYMRIKEGWVERVRSWRGDCRDFGGPRRGGCAGEDKDQTAPLVQEG